MSPEKHASIIDKIKKLFSLSKSPNEHEASLALDRARSLMVQYSIEQSELADDVEDIIEVDFQVSARFNTPSTILAYWIGEAFSCKPILMKTKTGYHKVDNKIRFIGAKSDLAVGTYVFSYILSILDAKSNEYFLSVKSSKSKWSPLAAKKVKTDYSIGFIDSVCKKLKDMKKEHEVINKYETEVYNALVISKMGKIEDYVKNNVGKTKQTKSKVSYDHNHYTAGSEAGSTVGIYKGVGSTNSQLQIGV